MEEVAILAGLALAVNKTVSVIKSFGKDTNAVVTQVLVWVIGVAAIFVAGQADITADLAVPGLTGVLGDLDFASVVLAGWILGSTGSFAFDIRKAIDNSDSAAEPSLLPDS
jgi:hypothetical protein